MCEMYGGIAWQYHSVCCISHIHPTDTILHYGLYCDVHRLGGTIPRYTRVNEYPAVDYWDYRRLCIDNAVLYGDKVCGTIVVKALMIR